MGSSWSDNVPWHVITRPITTGVPPSWHMPSTTGKGWLQPERVYPVHCWQSFPQPGPGYIYVLIVIVQYCIVSRFLRIGIYYFCPQDEKESTPSKPKGKNSVNQIIEIKCHFERKVKYLILINTNMVIVDKGSFTFLSHTGGRDLLHPTI